MGRASMLFVAGPWPGPLSYVLRPMSYVLCPVSYVLCPMSYVLCPMAYVLWPMAYVLYPMPPNTMQTPKYHANFGQFPIIIFSQGRNPHEHRQDSYVLCPVSYVLCPMSYVLCPMSYVLCPMAYVLCPMPYVLCRRLLSRCNGLQGEECRKLPLTQTSSSV